jgi:hypothetical protein
VRAERRKGVAQRTVEELDDEEKALVGEGLDEQEKELLKQVEALRAKRELLK